jgi:hypothetical protein
VEWDQNSTVDNSNIATSTEEKKNVKQSPSTSPPAKRPPGRPPGSPNKVTKNPPSPPVAKPPQDSVITDFSCQCGFNAVSERGLNIHRSLGRCTSPKLSGDNVSSDFKCAQCGFASVSERGLNIHRALGKCTSPKPTGDKIKAELTCAQCGFESVSERGLKIHRAIGKCVSPKLPPVANSQTTKPSTSPKNHKGVPEIEDEFMT